MLNNTAKRIIYVILLVFTPTESENYLNYQEKEETGGHWKVSMGRLLNTNSHVIFHPSSFFISELRL